MKKTTIQRGTRTLKENPVKSRSQALWAVVTTGPGGGGHSFFIKLVDVPEPSPAPWGVSVSPPQQLRVIFCFNQDPKSFTAEPSFYRMKLVEPMEEERKNSNREGQKE